MDRRTFLHTAVLTTVAVSLGDAAVDEQAQEARRRAGWIIPTNKPDRFGLKVMEFNPIPAPDPKTWTLTLEGLPGGTVTLTTADLDRLPRVVQSSRLKCVQCWSGRVTWEGFRGEALLRLAGPAGERPWVRVDCADRYYDFVKFEDLLHERTLFALGANGATLPPEHGAPLRLIIPSKYGYKSSKIITKLTFLDEGGMGLVADGWPYYSQSGDILPGIDRPFDFPGETRRIAGGEITEY
jgi:sulfoxide reductase catalytic subunit YedY